MSRSVTPSSTNQGSNNKKSARTISSKNHLYSGMDGVNESVAQPLMDGAARNKKEAKEADLKSLVASVRMQMTSSTFFGETYWNPRLHPQKTDNVITDKDVVCNNAASTDSCCLGNGCYLDMIKENSRKIFALYVEKARKKARVANNCGQKPVKDLELVKQLFSKLIVKRVRDRGGRFLILQTVGHKHEFAAGRNGDWIEIADIDAINKAKNDLTAAMEQEDDWESHKNVAELTIEPNEEEEEEEEEEEGEEMTVTTTEKLVGDQIGKLQEIDPWDVGKAVSIITIPSFPEADTDSGPGGIAIDPHSIELLNTNPGVGGNTWVLPKRGKPSKRASCPPTIFETSLWPQSRQPNDGLLTLDATKRGFQPPVLASEAATRGLQMKRGSCPPWLMSPSVEQMARKKRQKQSHQSCDTAETTKAITFVPGDGKNMELPTSPPPILRVASSSGNLGYSLGMERLSLGSYPHPTAVVSPTNICVNASSTSPEANGRIAFQGFRGISPDADSHGGTSIKEIGGYGLKSLGKMEIDEEGGGATLEDLEMIANLFGS